MFTLWLHWCSEKSMFLHSHAQNFEILSIIKTYSNKTWRREHDYRASVCLHKGEQQFPAGETYILKDPLLPAVSPFCEFLLSFLCSNDREWVLMERQTDPHHHPVSVNASLHCVYVFNSPTKAGEISWQLASVTNKPTAKNLRQIIQASKAFTWRQNEFSGAPTKYIFPCCWGLV